MYTKKNEGVRTILKVAAFLHKKNIISSHFHTLCSSLFTFKHQSVYSSVVVEPDEPAPAPPSSNLTAPVEETSNPAATPSCLPVEEAPASEPTVKEQSDMEVDVTKGEFFESVQSFYVFNVVFT